MQFKKRLGLYISALLVVLLVGIVFKNVFIKEATVNPIVENEDGTKQLVFDAKLTRLDESSTTFKEYNGKVLIVNFWASWCGPCQEEAPELKDFYNNKSENVELLAINATSKDSSENAMKFQESYNLNFPIFLDLDGTLQKSFEILAYPTTFIFDSKGILKYTIKGSINQKELNKYIEKLY
ncbi:TlpA family protein disulfide reductase [Lysinibacillus agricola]|uniref:TlpA family protein disulfide reductase n=1 Tax=Lysinibacillus agricola TaxID=2590012 RepID=A0ABX7AQ09_9BACI|nr:MULTISPECIES: TlpA disulfide reductase family protein [Lysinibacillus]KOS60417.1 thioredoxin family protein [Lysinibacillus sp. FJAT-14222]QQP11617.1 TlpA family protein disulfide reductase [Lysinibacillus agricola]